MYKIGLHVHVFIVLINKCFRACACPADLTQTWLLSMVLKLYKAYILGLKNGAATDV